MKKNIFTSLSLSLFFLFVFFCTLSNFSLAANYSREEVNDYLIEQSKLLNKQAPVMVDSATRFDSTIVTDLILHYRFTMINLTSNEITSASYQDDVRKKLINNCCKSDNIKEVFKLDVTYHYAYYGKDGQIIADIYIDRSDCNI